MVPRRVTTLLAAAAITILPASGLATADPPAGWGPIPHALPGNETGSALPGTGLTSGSAGLDTELSLGPPSGSAQLGGPHGRNLGRTSSRGHTANPDANVVSAEPNSHTDIDVRPNASAKETTLDAGVVLPLCLGSAAAGSAAGSAAVGSAGGSAALGSAAIGSASGSASAGSALGSAVGLLGAGLGSAVGSGSGGPALIGPGSSGGSAVFGSAAIGSAAVGSAATTAALVCLLGLGGPAPVPLGEPGLPLLVGAPAPLPPHPASVIAAPRPVAPVAEPRMPSPAQAVRPAQARNAESDSEPDPWNFTEWVTVLLVVVVIATGAPAVGRGRPR
ncbi:hypothetical protein [Nocardia terpenica]|uniref:Uncharacterized protein n=1 Tax=Nocardia terpenica TaxID=455432 RepID=A0A6G9Z3A1_9NOCA|nr:hypothetical protein [Nocardia terpenica]QIS19483.1 hypothetical protein F6W96_15545 [Nocardia terpenica]